MNQFEEYLEAYGHFNIRQLRDNQRMLQTAIEDEGDEIFEALDKPDLRIALRAVNELIERREN